jgi:DNA topoisomerase-1
MKLMILESGAKAKTVKKYLGKGWIVQACGGHVQDLPSKGSKGSSKSMWESEKGTLPEPPWGWTPGAEKKIKDMIKKAKKANVDEIYIATDPDREGEFIAWRLSIIFSDFDSQKRVTFNEITEKSVNEAINEARDIDTALVNSAKVRRFMDRLVGFECSRFSRTWKLASMGRVQTPTLGFIVERELLREKHVPINYHSVNFKIDNVNFKIRFHEKNDHEAWVDDDGKHFPDRTFDENLANQSIEILNKNKNIEIVSVKEGKSSRSPKPPFTTDTMLQAASSTLGWSVSKTSSIAGELYNLGHVTYIRTDSTRTNEDAREVVKKLIKDKYGEDFLGKGVLGPDAKKGTNNVQDAHEAIRPTRPEVAQLTEDLNQDLVTLYKLIWARFAASQMSNSIRETRRIEAKTENFNKKITGTASWRTHPGWEVVFNDYQKDIIEIPPNNNLEKGAKWEIICNTENPQLVSDETKPPRRYSESSIVQQMKKVGIGRPSTYVSTIQTLNRRKYVENNSGSLIPTDSGRTMWLEVVPFFNEQESRGLFNTDFTAKMESNLDTIEDSSQSAPKIWHDFVEKFVIINENAKTKKRSTPTKRQIELLNNLMKNMNENELANYLKGKKPNELTGDEMRETLDLIIKEGGDFPASEKQMNLIIKLSDQLSYKLEDICKIVSIDDINDLTGGKDGTASKVIDQLINESQLLPATESQVKLINKIATREELPLSDILSIANIVSIEELTKKDASKIIDTVMKKNKKSRKK